MFASSLSLNFCILSSSKIKFSGNIASVTLLYFLSLTILLRESLDFSLRRYSAIVSPLLAILSLLIILFIALRTIVCGVSVGVSSTTSSTGRLSEVLNISI